MKTRNLAFSLLLVLGAVFSVINSVLIKPLPYRDLPELPRRLERGLDGSDPAREGSRALHVCELPLGSGHDEHRRDDDDQSPQRGACGRKRDEAQPTHAKP